MKLQAGSLKRLANPSTGLHAGYHGTSVLTFRLFNNSGRLILKGIVRARFFNQTISLASLRITTCQPPKAETSGKSQQKPGMNLYYAGFY